MVNDNDEILRHTAHRPFPLAEGPWLLQQEWHDLLFAHWRVEPDALRPLVPQPLELDLWNGEAWVAVTPMYISGLTMRGMPRFPGVSQFLELNVRTYARFNGIPGVFFFSLDAANFSAVLGARAGYLLPYLHARMSARRERHRVMFRSSRRHRGSTAEFDATYSPLSDSAPPAQGTRENFLTNRYCLYTVGRGGRVFRGHIHHVPWPLQTAQAEIRQNTMARAAGIALPAGAAATALFPLHKSTGVAAAGRLRQQQQQLTISIGVANHFGIQQMIPACTTLCFYAAREHISPGAVRDLRLGEGVWRDLRAIEAAGGAGRDPGGCDPRALRHAVRRAQ
jgi:hypothetical protein